LLRKQERPALGASSVKFEVLLEITYVESEACMRPLFPRLLCLIQTLLQGEQSQNLVEYSLIVALLALGSVACLKNLSSSLSAFFIGISSALSSSTT
jgi:Flp pilus assembly pilin Flp